MGTRFTSDQKETFTGVSGLTITTYTMIAFTGRRSEESARVMEQIAGREWGLLLLDEVHVVPAQMFRKVCPYGRHARALGIQGCRSVQLTKQGMWLCRCCWHGRGMMKTLRNMDPSAIQS